MALTQFYRDNFTDGISWLRQAIQAATDNGIFAFNNERYASALYWSGVALVLEEIFQSFNQTFKDYLDLGFEAGKSLAEQDSIAVTVMRNIVNRDKVYIPRNSGSLGPAEALWNKGLLLSGIYMAGRWKGARMFYDSVLWANFGWASRTNNSMPFWGDEGVIY